MGEGVVVEEWDGGLGEGEWYVEVEEWVKKGKGKKRRSKAIYEVASALLYRQTRHGLGVRGEILSLVPHAECYHVCHVRCRFQVLCSNPFVLVLCPVFKSHYRRGGEPEVGMPWCGGGGGPDRCQSSGSTLAGWPMCPPDCHSGT